ncbi:MAG: hypothetical protein VKK42_15930 [Lyngbya sp.]|nr:hypothetical protein [Lyngbya sp.]
MFNFKNFLNSKIIALTAVVGIAPLITQSALAESTNFRGNSEQFEKGILISQATLDNGTTPTINNPGNVPTSQPLNQGDVQVPSNQNGVQRTVPGSTPINPQPTNNIDTRDYNSPGDQLDNNGVITDPDTRLDNNGTINSPGVPNNNGTINSPGTPLDNDATINSPGDQINNNDGYTNSPGDQIENDSGYIGVPAR